MEILLFLYVIFFCLLMIASYHKKYHKYYLFIKSCMSSIFVFMAFFAMKNTVNWTWMMAFVCCFLGDVFLGMDEKKDKIYFLLGVGSFIMGHLLFIITIHSYVPFNLFDMIFPLLMCIITYCLISTPYFDVKGHQKEIMIYSIVVSLLCVKGLDMFLIHSNNLSYFLGALLFFISDFILLFKYFYVHHINCLKFLNLLIYYSAVMLLAISF